MAGYTTPYPPDWKQQRRVMREQARMQRDAIRAQRQLYREQARASRGASILGPLVLIAIGVIFFLIETGRIQSSHAWAWYGRWWPMLLVFAGVLVLGEWAFDRFFATGDRPVVRRGIGFGLWMIFLLVILTGVVAAHSNNGELGLLSSRMHIGPNDETFAELFGNLHEMDEPFNHPLPAGSSLSIESPRGGVNISGTSTDGQMHIQLRREIYTNSDDDAQQKAQKLTPKFETSGQQVTVSLPFVDGTETGMTITVPPTTPLSISTAHGAIDVNGINAAITLSSNHGDVNATNINGSVNGHVTNTDSSFTVHNINGSVRMDGVGNDITATDVTGSVIITGGGGGSAHLERIHSSTSYHSNRTQFDTTRLDGQFDTNGKYLTVSQAFGPVTLNTSSYDITLDRISGNTAVRNSNGSIDVISAPPLGSINLENRSGLINLTVPEHANFTVEADASHGQIFSEFPSLQQQDQRNNHKALNGSIGTGGSFIHIVTTNGDVSLRKTDVKPLSGTPPAMVSSAEFSSHPSSTLNDTREQTRAEIRQAMQETKQQIRESAEEIRQARRDALNATQ